MIHTYQYIQYTAISLVYDLFSRNPESFISDSLKSIYCRFRIQTVKMTVNCLETVGIKTVERLFRMS